MYTKRNRVIARFLLLVFTFTMAMGIVPVGMMGTVNASEVHEVTIQLVDQAEHELNSLSTGEVVLVNAYEEEIRKNVNDGQAVFENVERGSYTVEYCGDGYRMVDSQPRIEVSEDQSTYTYKVKLNHEVAVNGRVVDEDGNVVPNAQVIVTGKIIENGNEKGSTTVNCANGVYGFTGIVGESYQLEAKAPNYTQNSESSNTFTLTDGATSGPDLKLDTPKYVLSVKFGANGAVKYVDDSGQLKGAVETQTLRMSGYESGRDVKVVATASDASYCVSSFKVNGVAQTVGTNADTYEYNVHFQKGKNQSASVEVTFAKKVYNVGVQSDNGFASIDSAIAEYGSAKEIRIKPNDGFYLKGIKISSGSATTDVDMSNDTNLSFDENTGEYIYTLSSIQSDCTVIPVYEKQGNITLNDYEITFDKAVKEVNGVTYVSKGTKVTVKAKGSYDKIRLNGNYKHRSPSITVTMGNDGLTELKKVEVGTTFIFTFWSGKTSLRIQLDTDGPTVGDDLESAMGKVKGKYWADGEITYTATATDSKAGVDDSSAKVVGPDGKDVDCTAKDGKISFVPTQKGKYTLSISDCVGNTSTKEYTFYTDNTAPTIKGFVVEKSTAEQVLNFLSFGAFGNNGVKVTVEAEDNADGIGVKSICLFVDGKKFESKNTVDNRAEFIVPKDALGDNEKFNIESLGAKATDLLKNEAEKEAKAAGNNINGGITTNGSFTFETIKPEIDMTIPKSAETMNPLTSGGKNSFSGDVDYTITVSDKDSGIEKLDVKINGVALDADKNGKAFEGYTAEKHEEETFVVSTAQGTITEDGVFEVEVTVTDNSGNTDTKKMSNFKDDKNPSVSEVNFYGTGNNEGTGKLFGEEHPDYGYFFSSDTEVEVKTTDPEPSSGLNYVEYYLVDVKGKTSATQRELVDADGVARFTIATGFKGQLYVSAVDNVENRSRFLTPDAIVLENNTEHNALDHISFTVPESDKTTATGAPLYSDDVDVAINVMDDVAGIKSVEWSVESAQDTGNNYSGSLEIDKNKNIKYNQGKTEADWEIAATDRNLVTKLTNTMTIKNNSNGIVVYVRITDRAGNVSDNQVVLNIDKTAPVVSVAYDNNAGDKTYGDIFNANRTATVTIKERNFSAANVDCTLKNKDGKAPSLSDWTEAVDASNPDNNTYTAKVVFDKDGNYQFSLGFTDLAGNVAASKVENEFIIDKTKPVFKVSYDNDNAQNEKYYASDRTATITVEEHNFDPKRVELLGKATDNGAAVAYPSISSWTSSGDKHSATITYSADALYVFDIAMKDKAGNDSDEYVQEEFYIDKTAPVVEINNVEGANKGDVSPQVSIQDTNYNPAGVDIDLTRVNGAGKPNPASYERGTSENGNGATITYANFPKEKEYDDIYTMNAVVTDMAGNQADANQRFSVNRFGSTYDLTALKEYNGKWYQSLDEDLVFTEMNADPLNNDSLVIKMTKNGSSTELTQGKDFTLKQTGGDGRWSEYEYTIKKDLFNDDAWYSVATYSEDTATNINENIDEEKHADISFGIDKTSPVITLAGLENGETYAEETKTVKAEIKDNMALDTDSVVITVDGKAVDNVKMDSADGVTYVYTFDIQEAPASRIVCVSAADQAGNEYEDDVDHVLITTNAIARLMNNVPMMIATAVGVVAVGGGAVAAGVAISGAKAGGAAAAGFKFFKKK